MIRTSTAMSLLISVFKNVLLGILLFSLGSYACYNPPSIKYFEGLPSYNETHSLWNPNSQGLQMIKDIGRMINSYVFGVNIRGCCSRGGDDIIAEYPYQVSVQNFGIHRCGGAIINKKFFLTSAGCLKFGGVFTGLYTVRSSSSSIMREGHIHYVGKILILPHREMEYRVALAQVHPPFAFSEYAKPVDLPESDTISTATATVTGWKVANENENAMGQMAKRLQHRSVPILANTECADGYAGNDNFPDFLICGGYDGKEVCAVEPGSPLVSDGKLIGIAVKARSCSSPWKPDLYLNIAQVRESIIESTNT